MNVTVTLNGKKIEPKKMTLDEKKKLADDLNKQALTSMGYKVKRR